MLIYYVYIYWCNSETKGRHHCRCGLSTNYCKLQPNSWGVWIWLINTYYATTALNIMNETMAQDYMMMLLSMQQKSTMLVTCLPNSQSHSQTLSIVHAIMQPLLASRLGPGCTPSLKESRLIWKYFPYHSEVRR